MKKDYYAVIMAGGGGTRLWPLSRQAYPKQMLQLSGDRSLFQIAVHRLESLFPPERVLVVTTKDQAGTLQSHCPQLPEENYLLEPEPRGTASVIGLAAIALKQRDPHAVMAVLTSDHYIGNVPRFHQLLSAAYQVARQGRLVTLGIHPMYPATGYGYIQKGERLGTIDGLDYFRVQKFKEKPDLTQARVMIADGQHSWNSGMFVWQVEDVLGEFERQMPDLFEHLQTLSGTWGGPHFQEILAEVWPRLRAQTIDYGIMEGAGNVAVIPATELEWNDIGTWDSLFEILPKDLQGNIVNSDQVMTLDTQNTLVYTRQSEHLIVTIGLEDMIIVDTGDVFLICPKDQAQKVRQVVNQLKTARPDYV